MLALRTRSACSQQTLMPPAASAMTRRVLESKVMSASRSAGDVGLDANAVLILLNACDGFSRFLLRAGGRRFQVDAGSFIKRPLQVRHRRSRRGAEQAERRLRFHRDFDVAQTQRLLRLINLGHGPNMEDGFGAKPEGALLLLGTHEERDQQPFSGRCHACAFHGDVDGTGAILRNVRPVSCASRILFSSVNGRSIGRAMLTPPASRE